MVTFDNSDKKQSPLGFEVHDEITVTRRYYRAGDSAYFINRKPCRLKDIYELFMNTGVGREGYSIIGQGKVAEIVGDDVFINLSMAPIFPYNYANGRRLCCDTYYKINETEYMLNSLTYGFWQSELYDWIDPDHIVVWGKDDIIYEKNEIVNHRYNLSKNWHLHAKSGK